MIRFLLRATNCLVARLAAANNVIGNIEYFDLDPCDIGASKSITRPQLQGTLNRRLRVYLRIVFLENRILNRFEVLVTPLDFKRACDSFFESLVAFEDFLRTCYAS